MSENIAVGSPTIEVARPETLVSPPAFRGNNDFGELTVAVTDENSPIDESVLARIRFSARKTRDYIVYLSGILHGADVASQDEEGFTIGAVGASNLLPGTYVVKWQIKELG